jgi:PKHD-type hydroxylase
MKVLNDNQINKIKKYYDSAIFESGRWGGKTVNLDKKNNLEADHGESYRDKKYIEVSDIVAHALEDCHDFRNYILPVSISIMNFARYTEGMYYGFHNDNYVMQHKSSGDYIRTDYSCTLFLSSPDDYDGGELVLQIGNQTQSFKLDSGYAIFYPTTYIHKVNEVTRGTRDVVVFWIQSKIRDSMIRELICDIHEINKEYKDKLNTAEFDNLNNRLTHIYMQLRRRFSD